MRFSHRLVGLASLAVLFAGPAAAIELTQKANPHDRAFERLPDLNMVRGRQLKKIELEVTAEAMETWTLEADQPWMSLELPAQLVGPATVTVRFDRAALDLLDNPLGTLTLTSDADPSQPVTLEVNIDVWPKLPPENATPAEIRAFVRDRANWPSDNSYHDDWERFGFIPDEVSHPDSIASAPTDAWERTACPPGEDRDDCVSEGQAGLASGMSADISWLRSTGDERVVIAVLDSGIKWSEFDLVNKHYLNAEELRSCPPPGADAAAVDVFAAFDVNEDGVFNIRDYDEAAWAVDLNANGLMDPQDIIHGNNGENACSDGTDDDGNGYIDDISGWDFFWNDNDPSDDTNYGHGTGEANDSGAEPHNGSGTVGFCPRCSILNVRVGDSFIVDVNQFADGVVFAVESGASVVQEALGSLNNTPYAQKAIDYAYHNNVAIIASAADERSYHHNYPGNLEHTLYVHAIVADTDGDFEEAATFLNFGNCTNFGAKLALSTPGTGCSSEATGNTSGQAGLTYAHFLQTKEAAVGTGNESYYVAPLSAEELYQLLKMNADDIDVPGMEADPAALEAKRYPSNEGWDLHFGYGRNNAFRPLDAITNMAIPPEADISSPRWFELIDPSRRPTVEVTGTVGSPRLSNLRWELAVADGVLGKNAIKIAEGSGAVDNASLGTLDLSRAGPLSALVERSAQPAGDDPEAFTATLILTVFGENPMGDDVRGEFRKAFAVRTDDTMHEAFPIYLGASGESSPKLSDLDGDGTEEIVVATADGLVHAIDRDGVELPGYPVSLPLYAPFNDTVCATAGDPRCFRNVRAFQDGVEHGIDPDTLFASVSKPSVAIGDLNGDGSPGRDVIVATLDGSIIAYDADGNQLEGFPVMMDPSHVSEFEWSFNCDDGQGNTIIGCRTRQRFADYGFATSPTLVDLDGDGDLEIVIGAMDQWAYAWHHDGAVVNGWPVHLLNDNIPAFNDVGDIFRHDGRIVSDPVVADLFGDGTPIIVMGTNERKENSNESFLYALWPDGNAHDGGAYLDGWPAPMNGFIPDEILPFIGRGMPNAPAVGDWDDDGKDEVVGAGIGGFITVLDESGRDEVIMETTSLYYGVNANVNEPAGSVPVINNPSIADLDGDGRLDIINGTAGFGLVQVASNGGLRAEFDHSVSAWVSTNGYYLDGFPHRAWDYQFFMNYAVADLDNDDLWNVIYGDGGYFVYAPDADGEEAAGFPKFTSQWHIGTPAVGDLDGDGNIDVVANTREGWLYAWKTEGPVAKAGDIPAIQWAGFQHDDANTGNARTPLPERELLNPPDDTEVPFGFCSHTAPAGRPSALGLLAAAGILGSLVRRRRRR
jgi:hypothetical protein